MAKNKDKKQFIINNLLYSFVYFLVLIAFIEIIVGFIFILNTGIILGILLFSLISILAPITLFYVIKEHISEIKEYKVMVLKKQLLPLENIIGELGEGKMLRGRDNK